MKTTDRLTMSPTNSSFHQLMDVDPGTVYHIPLYQRDYTWRSGIEVQDFLDDVRESFKEQRHRFFGTILLSTNAPQPDHPTSFPTLYVIDGQQRLTTTLLALAAMRHMALEMSEGLPSAIELATRISDRIYLRGTKGESEPRLFANRANSSFLTKVLAPESLSFAHVKALFNSIKPKATQQRCQAIYDAYETAYLTIRSLLVETTKGIVVDDESTEPITAWLSAHADREKATSVLEEFRNHFLQNSQIVKIRIEDWQESFELFDGLNNRGMDLAKKDVLKNVLLSRAARGGEKEVTAIDKQWQEFSDVSNGYDFTRFLRHWLSIETPSVSLSGVTRFFIVSTKDEKVGETMGRLQMAALNYQAIVEPSQQLINDVDTVRVLEHLVVMAAERTRPVILAALLSDCTAKQLLPLVSALELLQFRRSAICQLDNKSLEKEVQKIAAALRKKGHKGIPEAIRAIRALSPDDTKFRNDFLIKSGMPDGIARYLLLKIENHIRTERGQIPLDPAKVTLEHIVPKNPLEHWKLDKTRQDVKDMIGRLGNLTLLTGPKNSEVSNLDFETKKKHYGALEDVPVISQDVLASPDWTAKEVERRQQTLADYAMKVWAIA